MKILDTKTGNEEKSAGVKSFNNKKGELMTFDEAVQKVSNIAAKFNSFKIGKTGQNLDDRFDSNYKETYSEIRLICRSKNKGDIDNWEEKLIERFKSDPKNDNEIIGGGDMGDSDEYYIYVVVK